MKHIQRLLGFGRNKYFHHRYGVIYLNKRSRILALYTGIFLTLGGGFFMVSHFAVPAVRHLIAMQKQHPIAVNSTVLAESALSENTAPETRHENAVLTELIKEKLATFPADQKWGVFMYDLKDKGMVNINSDQVFPAGSLYKLFLLEALESKLPYEKWSYTWTPEGTNIQDCVYDMLRASDSACAEDISNYIGWGVVDRLNQKNGFDHTKIAGIDGRETTASDVGEFLIRLKKNHILSDKARRFVFDALYQQTNKKGITAGCEDCRAADKIGEMTGVENDAGIVTHGNHSYVLVILSQGGSLKQIADITKTIQTQ